MWYESHSTVGRIKSIMSDLQDQIGGGVEMAIRTELDSVTTLLGCAPVKTVLFEVSSEHLLARWPSIQTLRLKWPEVKWIALLTLGHGDGNLILNGFDEFIERGELNAETLIDRLYRPRTVYERTEALGLEGIVDQERIEVISRIIAEQPEIRGYEAEALMCGIHTSEKKKLRQKFEEIFKVTEKRPEFINQRLKLCVFGNSEYGCELGWVFSKKFKRKTLIVDADRLFPSLDLLLEARKTVTDSLEGYDSYQSTGLNILLDAIRKNSLNSEKIMSACSRIKGNSDLYALTGSYNLNDYEYYDKDDFMRLLERLDTCFEVVIMLVNAFIYDAFTAVSLLVSDKNLIPVSDGVLALRSAASSAAYVTERQKIDRLKHQFIAYDTDEFFSLSTDDYEALTGSRYLGRIPSSTKREKARKEGKMHGPIMDRITLEAHEKIIIKLMHEMRG